MTLVSPVGTLAYIIDEEALLVRVNRGWQYVAVRCYFYDLKKNNYFQLYCKVYNLVKLNLISSWVLLCPSRQSLRLQLHQRRK